MTTKTRPTASGTPSEIVRGWDMPNEERERRVREAAYGRLVRRSHAHGHDLDDWLAAEAALFAGEREVALPGRGAGVDGEVEVRGLDVQQHSIQSPHEDEDTKRAIRKQPRRAIPQIEGIEPEQAPFRA